MTTPFSANCRIALQREGEAPAGAAEADLQSDMQWLDDALYRVDRAGALARALFSLYPEHRLPAVETMLQWLEPDWPGVPFGRQLAEARTWAAWASLRQRKALTLAGYESLPRRDQGAFLDHVGSRRLAA